MICFSNDDHNNSLISLWVEAFGDSKAYAEFYLNNSKGSRKLIFVENDVVLATLSLIPAKIVENNIETPSYYVYGVATRKSHRGRGLSSSLMEYASEIAKKERKHLFLIPSTQSLFGFYKKLGYISSFCLKETSVSTTHIGRTFLTPYKTSFLSVSELYSIRSAYLKNTTYVEWSYNEIEYILAENSFSGGGNLKITVNDIDYYALYLINNNIFVSLESSIPEEIIINVLSQIASEKGCMSLVVRTPCWSSLQGISKEFGMVKTYDGSSLDSGYLNLALDL